VTDLVQEHGGVQQHGVGESDEVAERPVDVLGDLRFEHHGDHDRDDEPGR
jgi:hypothetical protein